MHQPDPSKIPVTAIVDDTKRTCLGWAKCGVCKQGEPSDDAVRVTFTCSQERGWHDVYVHAHDCFHKLIESHRQRTT